MNSVTFTISAAPLVTLLQPLAVATATSAIGALGSWAAYLASRYLHIQIVQAAINTVISKAQTYAGTLIANDAANLAGKSITVSDARVAAAANSIAANLPKMLAASGWTEDRIAKLIIGEIGKLQAQAVPASVATASVAPAAAA